MHIRTRAHPTVHTYTNARTCPHACAHGTAIVHTHSCNLACLHVLHACTHARTTPHYVRTRMYTYTHANIHALIVTRAEMHSTYASHTDIQQYAHA